MNRKLIFVAAAVAALAGGVAAQAITVTGTGDPNIDVPAVQAAVDHGGRVVLMGHFSFDRPPTTPAGAIYSRMVTVSKHVVITGSLDGNGDMTMIDGGNWPFHFVGPKPGAIWVYSVGGLLVAGCRIESVQQTVEFGMEAGQANALAGAIFVGTDPHPPSAANPGGPGNFSGTLAILNNDINVGAMPGTRTLGVIFAVGRSPDKEVEIYVSGNNIRNVIEPAINFRVLGERTPSGTC